MTCEHAIFRNFPLSERNEVPRIMLRQCVECLHWWLTYAQEVEPHSRLSRSYFSTLRVSGVFKTAAVPRRAWADV